MILTTNYYCPTCGRVTHSRDRNHDCGNITKPRPTRCRDCGRAHFWWYDEHQVWVCHFCGARPPRGQEVPTPQTPRTVTTKRDTAITKCGSPQMVMAL